MHDIKIIAISGSLRSRSSNTALLLAASELAPGNAKVALYEGLGALPHFNPDMDENGAPDPVRQLRNQLAKADGVLICTPEYANGVPGSLKNALDWLVSSGEMYGKPAAVISASPSPMGGDKAYESLLQTLNMLGAKMADGMKIPFVSKKLDADGRMTDPATRLALQALLVSFAHAAERSFG